MKFKLQSLDKSLLLNSKYQNGKGKPGVFFY